MDFHLPFQLFNVDHISSSPGITNLFTIYQIKYKIGWKSPKTQKNGAIFFPKHPHMYFTPSKYMYILFSKLMPSYNHKLTTITKIPCWGGGGGMHMHSPLPHLTEQGGKVASQLVRSSSDQAVWVWALAKNVLCSWARQLLLKCPWFHPAE